MYERGMENKASTSIHLAYTHTDSARRCFRSIDVPRFEHEEEHGFH